MSTLAIVEAIATLLWCYAGVTFVVWAGHLKRASRREHIPHVTDLLGNLVPAMITLLVVVIAGAMIGLPSVVVLIAILFPAGLAFGMHMSLNDIRPQASLRGELARIGLALALGAVIITLRQIA
jgi:hypothetical protein